MSTVRMCDKCGEVFSERADGWSTFTGAVRMRDPNTGRAIMREESLDACPDCSELMTGSTAVPSPITPGGAQRRYERAELPPGPVGDAAAEPRRLRHRQTGSNG
jgi:hypothetical protein